MATALVIGSDGGIGSALCDRLRSAAGIDDVVGLARASTPPVDVTDEASIAEAAGMLRARHTDLRLVINATGFLHGGDFMPEKRLRQLDAGHLARAFAVNAIGPALLLKHFLPLLPREGRAVFASLSARVGSIGDNHSGGWFAYRASKAAQNQIVRSAAIELARSHADAICVVLHPGTVDTRLSQPFARTGLSVQSPAVAAAQLLDVIGRLTPADSGGFFDQHGKAVPW